MTPEDIKHLQKIKEYLSGIRGCEFEGMAITEMPWLVEKLESLEAAPSGGDGARLLKAAQDIVKCIRDMEVGDYSPIMDELLDLEHEIRAAGGESAPEPPAQYENGPGGLRLPIVVGAAPPAASSQPAEAELKQAPQSLNSVRDFSAAGDGARERLENFLWLCDECGEKRGTHWTEDKKS